MQQGLSALRSSAGPLFRRPAAESRREEIQVGPGKFFYDYEHDAVYFADDPSGHTVELSYRPFAFGGAAQDVIIENLIVENYASRRSAGRHRRSSRGQGLADTQRRGALESRRRHLHAAVQRAARQFHPSQWRTRRGAGSGGGSFEETKSRSTSGTAPTAPGNAAARNGRRSRNGSWKTTTSTTIRARPVGRYRFKANGIRAEPHRKQSLRRYLLRDQQFRHHLEQHFQGQRREDLRLGLGRADPDPEFLGCAGL